MNDELLFWLILFAIFVFRQLVGKKRPPARQPAAGPQRVPPGVPDPSIQPTIAKPEIASQEPSRPAEFEDALEELRKALGFGEPEKPHRDVEAFGEAEERFEKERAYRDYTQSSEERFEAQPAYSVPASDREDAFEQTDDFAASAVFYDEGFESKPLSSEVSFRGAWKGHESDFEYHSALERSTPGTEKANLVRQEDARPPGRTPLLNRLKSASDLRQAVILHEILGPPLGLRKPVRRRPS